MAGSVRLCLHPATAHPSPSRELPSDASRTRRRRRRDACDVHPDRRPTTAARLVDRCVVARGGDSTKL
ncbi:hypothetical protein L596_008660 [Steinernema carpocapsae]|uniref:Uncharacterized protein n=1 Tax=Steinernema carpocapsae TaxID=34508 RepID=A0A4U5PDF1_STECR|nr:hypothetical protein L596_008660 [Steinernema carpocapsae]